MFGNLKGDLAGGVTSAIIALPLALAFGIVAFGPLGPEYYSRGALACLFGVVATGFFSSLFGGVPARITSPTGPMSVMFAAMLAAALQSPAAENLEFSSRSDAVLALVFFTVFLAGLLQILLGISGGGRLVKYIPYPVVAGFMNGVALIIFLGQLEPFLGLGEGEAMSDFFAGDASPSWIAIAAGTATILAMELVPRWIEAVPGALAGMVAGIACFFAIGFATAPEVLSVADNPLVIGHIPASMPSPALIDDFRKLVGGMDASAWAAVLAPALTLAMLGSVNSLLVALVADNATKTRHNSVLELTGQGIGNMLAAVCGGLPGAGSTSRTLANIQSGARGRLSGMFYALVVFVLVVFFGRYAAYIPYAVLSGILIVTACRMVDVWSLGLIRQKSTLKDMAIVVVVAGTTVVADLITAVGLGVAITVILFVRDQVSRSVVKGSFTGREMKSKKVRSADERDFLRKEGGKIRVYQIDGFVFFGTADGLRKEIERKEKEAEIVILDFKLVKDIDLTRAQILKQIDDGLREKEKHLILSYVGNPEAPEDRRISRLLTDVEVFDQIGEKKLFQDTDRALEWAEDHLIDEASAHVGPDARRVDPKRMKIFQYLEREELGELEPLLSRSEHRADEIIFREGDRGDTMFMVARGSVGILLNIGDGEWQKRIASFGPGVFFGEMALLEDKPRSATAVAEAETELYALGKRQFLALLGTKPDVASKIQWGISQELAGRLRSSDEEIRALEV